MIAIYFIISALIIGVDQWVKAWIVANFQLGETQSILPHFFSLTYLQNTGAAWSLFEGKLTFFTIITIIAVVVVVYLFVKNTKGHFLFLLGLSLILAGALGNFIDRIRLGYVVDMIQVDFVSFPIFNIADMSLTIGVALLFIYTIFEERLKGLTHAK